MRLPFLQVTQEAWAKSRMLAPLLGMKRREAFGLICDLWAWGLELGPLDEPPTGECRNPLAARMMAGALEWEGDANALATALEAVGLLEGLPDGIRVRGMSRYAATWRKNRRAPDRKPGRCRTESERNPPGISGETEAKPVRQTHTQTQTQTYKQEAVCADAPAAPEVFKLEVQKGPTPRKRSQGQGFWDWAQEQRTAKTGRPQEREPPPAKLNAWFGQAMAQMHTQEDLGRAYARFLLRPRDDYWPSRGFPFQGFMAVWSEYADPHAGRGEVSA